MALSTKLLLFSALSLSLLLPFSSGQTAVNGGYWFPESGFAASNIDSTYFTHLFCAFAGLDPQTNRLTVDPSNTASFSQFTATVRAKNPSVKTLLSIGGGDANSSVFSSMASRPASRKSFIDSSISLARSYGFSGLDLDWEYPDQTSSDMTNLGSLLSEWRQAIAAEAQSSGNPRLLLTAAFYFSAIYDSPNLNARLNYPARIINQTLDWVNVMAYDLYGPSWVDFTNGPAILYDPSGQASGSKGIADWIRAGVSPNKLALGVPFYGYVWRLANANNHGMLAPAISPGDGTMQYDEIKTFIADNNAAVVYNATVVTNYCYSGTTWIGYDDIQSISAKVAYAKQNRLLGYFAWHVGADSNWALSKQAKQSWGANMYSVADPENLKWAKQSWGA